MNESLVEASDNPLSAAPPDLAAAPLPQHDPCGEGALGSRSVLDAQEQQLEATLEDRGVRGAFLRCGGVELPLAFADIQRDAATVTVTVHAAVHPDCAQHASSARSGPAHHCVETHPVLNVRIDSVTQ